MTFKKGYVPWNKGKACSEEHKKNVSLSKIGKKHPHKGSTQQKIGNFTQTKLGGFNA